jgi:ubiquitin carboxyl-terminal hydrolase 34
MMRTPDLEADDFREYEGVMGNDKLLY